MPLQQSKPAAPRAALARVLAAESGRWLFPLLSTAGTTPVVLGLKPIQQRATEMMKGLEHLTSEERLRGLKWQHKLKYRKFSSNKNPNPKMLSPCSGDPTLEQVAQAICLARALGNLI